MDTLVLNGDLLHQSISRPFQTMLPQKAVIDCCLGSNPFGPPIALESIKLEVNANEYLKPQAEDELIYALARFFDLSPEYMNLNAGSAQCITTLFSRFLNPKDRLMLGIGPQFIHAVQEWDYFGGRYKSLPLINHQPTSSLKQSVCETFIEMLHKEKPDVVYIDNPNNPTGFFFEIYEMFDIIKCCKSLGALCIVDEAYIDYIPKEHSALYLVPEFDHLIVLRSLSKGFGLAALRIGFTIAHPKIVNRLDQLTTPFPISTPSFYIAQHVFANVDLDAYFKLSAQFTAQCKYQLVQTATEAGFHVPTTHPQIPIFTLTHPDQSVIDYFNRMYVVATNSLAYQTHFNGPEFVRLRIPQSERELYQLCTRLKQS